MPIDDHAHAKPLKPKPKATSRIIAERRMEWTTVVVERMSPFVLGAGSARYVVQCFTKKFFRSEADALSYCRKHHRLTWELSDTKKQEI